MNRDAISGRGRTLAGLLVLVTLLLPLYGLPTSSGELSLRWPIGLAAEGPSSAVALLLAYCWPVAAFLLRGARPGTVWGAVARPLEAVLPVVSSLIVWTILTTTMGLLRPFGPWMLLPVGATMATGGALLLVADAAYVVCWVVGLGRARQRSEPARA
jgi:hypothetical protein